MKKKLVIDYTTKDIVVRIFNLYHNGYSYKKISNLFNSEKVLNRTNWRDSTIYTILQNEIYKGDFVHGKRTKSPTYYNDVVEPIISKELWEECQVQTRKNTRNYTRRNDYIFFQKIICPHCKNIMACKAPGGSKKKYIYYQCNKCKTSIRENYLVDLLVDEITSIIEYDMTVKKFFAPLLKHKVENTNELLLKELNKLKDKKVRLKDPYLNKIIEIDEYNEDNNYLETRINDINNKIKEEQELEQFNFTSEDLMLKRDLEFIKSINDSNYNNSFKIKWNELSIKEKQDLIMSYIESIEVIKKDDKIEIKNINFRKTFIEEYANLFNNGSVSVYQEILMNDEKIQIEVSKPMTRKDVHEYIKRLQYNYPVIDYHEVPKEISTNNKFILKYQRENILYEPMKIIPLLNKKGITKVTHYGIIEIPIVHSTFIKI